jgi:hypothetical protein
MGVRGRQSLKSLELSPANGLETVDRQRPPHELTDEEVEVWAGVVAAEPATWFSASTAPLLAQYCRHAIQAKRIGLLIEKATSDPDLKCRDYDRLLVMQARETAAIAMLATKMRIAQQSTTNHRGNKKPSAARKLWEG